MADKPNTPSATVGASDLSEALRIAETLANKPSTSSAEFFAIMALICAVQQKEMGK